MGVLIPEIKKRVMEKLVKVKLKESLVRRQ